MSDELLAAGFAPRVLRRVLAPSLVAGLLFLPISAAHAQGYGESSWGISTSTLDDMIRADIMNRSLESLQDATNPAENSTPPKKKAASPPPTTPQKSPLDVSLALSATGKSFTSESGVEKLTQMFPGEDPKEVKQKLTQSIIASGDAIQQRYGIPKLNLATGVTTAIVGAYQAYSGQSFPPAYIKPLFEQMDRVLRSSPAITGAALADKAATYQTNMGIGLIFDSTAEMLKQNKDERVAAQVRQQSGAFLQNYFGVAPDRLRFDANGVSMR